MFFVLVHGRRVETTRLFDCPLFCGACADVQIHDVLRATEQSHVYFVDVGPADQTEMTRCTSCGHIAGCNASTLNEDGEIRVEGRRPRSDVDAFIRAHGSLALALRWSPRRVVVATTLVALCAGLSAAIASFAGIGLAGFGLFVGLVPMALFGYHEITRADLDGQIARELEPKVERLLKRTSLPIRAFAPRALQLGYPRLARFFATSAFESLGKTRSPYR